MGPEHSMALKNLANTMQLANDTYKQLLTAKNNIKQNKQMNFKEILSKVEEFQNATDQPVSKTPCIGDDKNNTLRYQLMEEENKEYLVATLQEDKVEILDAVVDMLYILAGTINQHGLQDLIEPAFQLVHANNMTKVGPDGKVLRNPEGKILKPEGFKPVDLKQLFKQ